MNEQELKNIWNSSSQISKISIQTNLLVKELNSEVVDMQKKIRSRDVREISASVFGILIFCYLLYEIPFPITKFACSLSIVWFVFVIVKFIKSKKQNKFVDISIPLIEQLETQKVIVQQQAALLDSVAIWYAIPPFAINVVFIIGLKSPVDYHWTNTFAENILPLSIELKVITLTGLSILYSFIIWINKRVVAKEITSLLENIKIVLNQLKSE